MKKILLILVLLGLLVPVVSLAKEKRESLSYSKRAWVGRTITIKGVVDTCVGLFDGEKLLASTCDNKKRKHKLKIPNIPNGNYSLGSYSQCFYRGKKTEQSLGIPPFCDTHTIFGEIEIVDKND